MTRAKRTVLGTVVLVVGLLTACSKPNPDFCCVTEAQCAQLGGDDIRPCRPGQACSGGYCVASQCSTSADCSDPASPVCVLNLCVAMCTVDEDCAGSPSGPHCASDGACVGCTTNDQCPANQAFCDVEDRTCRGCERDDECESGVCLEADGRCASEGEVVYLSTMGRDVGECTRIAPCARLEYGLTKLHTFPAPTRLVIHFDGGNLRLMGDVALTTPLYFDGTGTTIAGDGSGPYFTVMTPGAITLANIAIAPSSGAAVTVAGTLRLFNSDITRLVETTGGTITAIRTKFNALPQFMGLEALKCVGGTLTVTQSHFVDAPLVSSNCQFTATSNTFNINGNGMLSVGGGKIVFENNLVIQADEGADTANLGGGAPGSVVRFNTFVASSNVVSDGAALYCDTTLDLSSNIFAFQSGHPFGTSTCQSKYSLFDRAAIPEQIRGVGNKTTSAESIFANKAALDFHLAPASAAREGGESNLGVTVDIEGTPRPQPVGSNPDMGAFEAP